ncbi:uncharacterized protein A4U43_C03F31920 [Asparagus officinalis]|uniref:Transcription factor MYC/MYB N-terminal domain-containing protein n=1 Tax=Asparagus officinalis TaxID=4686 RepID=A0A5P1FH73_ASPOF|nr:uncharacterized protein A4U43_C03F31920 [Asparagus officinalis]
MNDIARSISSTGLQQMLQLAVQSVQWTYSIFWRLCPRQGILVWGDGYYNGVIKTRKTGTEEAVPAEKPELSATLRALSTGEANQQAAQAMHCPVA